MYNLVDIVQLKTGKDREDIEAILTSAIEHTLEYLEQGSDVYWIGLGRFTWKQKAKTKKEAKEWTEFPYMAEGDKVRFVPIEDISPVSIKGPVLKVQKEGDNDRETLQ